MNRLTEKINNWRWRLKGVNRKQITPGAEITDEVWRKLYGALCRLKDYEDTGLMPDEIERMKGKERQQWISVEERLPEENKSVLLYMKSRSSSGTCIQTGSIDKGFWFTQSYPGFQGLANREFHVMAWMPLPGPYTEEKE